MLPNEKKIITKEKDVVIPERKIVKERLKIMRDLHGWTQQEVADILGMPRPTYTGYEKGVREAGYVTLVKFSELYGCSLDYLFGKTDEPFAPDLEEIIEQPIRYKGYTLTPEEIEEYIKVLDLAVELKRAEEEKQKIVEEYNHISKKKRKRKKIEENQEIQNSFDISEEVKQLN